MENGEDDVIVEVEALDESEEKLYQFFQELQKDSLKTIEEAARQMIGLSTTLLGVFFGVLAFQDSPAFLAYMDVKALGIFSAGALFAGLFFALDVVMPRPVPVPQKDLTWMKSILAGLYQRKTRALRWAQLAFGFGTLFLVGIIIRLLLFG